MNCKNCGTKTAGICDVCRLVDGDKGVKWVVYCPTCEAYICETCEGNRAKRAAAMLLDNAHKINEYFKKKFGL